MEERGPQPGRAVVRITLLFNEKAWQDTIENIEEGLMKQWFPTSYGMIFFM
jgi:hypothetical protein